MNLHQPSVSVNIEDLEWQPKEKSAVSKLFESCLFCLFSLNNIDFFKIYKVESTDDLDKSSRRIYQRHELRLKENTWDKLRKSYLAKFMYSTMGIIALKSYLTSFADFFAYQIGNGYDDIATLRVKSWFSETTLKKISASLGSPMKQEVGLSIFLGVCLPSPIIISGILMPVYFSHSPIDLPDIRFRFEPLREIRRIDLMIGYRVSEILASLNSYRLQMIRDFREERERQKASDRRQQRKELYWSEIRHLNSYRRILLGCQRSRIDLRPDVFSETWYNNLQDETLKWMLGYTNYLSSWLIFCGLFITIVPLMDRCKYLKIEKCDLVWTFKTHLTTQERMSLIAMLINAILISTTYMPQDYSYLMCLKRQYKIIKGLKIELCKCLDELRILNLSHSTGTSSQNINMYPNPVERDGHADEIVIKSFIKISVSIDELRNGTRYLTEFLTELSSNMIHFVLMTLVTWHMNTEMSTMFKVTLLLNYWIFINVWAALTSILLIKFQHLEKTYRSIMVELATRRARLETEDHDFMSKLWKKLINYISSNYSDLCTTKSFGIPMSFAKIIELNFSILNIVTIVFS